MLIPVLDDLRSLSPTKRKHNCLTVFINKKQFTCYKPLGNCSTSAASLIVAQIRIQYNFQRNLYMPRYCAIYLTIRQSERQ